MKFITAQWKNLIMANYVINPEYLKKYIPAGTELDLWNGNCYISLVGFLFKNTKVLGLSIPNYTDFEEVNLRFYVKRFEKGQWKRGVVFIQEIVPKNIIAFVANTVYKENYKTLVMQHEHQLKAEIRKVGYQWKNQNKKNHITVNAYDFATTIEDGTEAAFITEHYFGYTKYNENTSYEYEVKHPKWEQYLIKNFDIKIDYKNVYGTDFEFMNNMNPSSIILAKGSKISVGNKRKIKL